MIMIPVIPAYKYDIEASHVREFINNLKAAKLRRAVSAARSVA